jgi:hypothetical protein
MAIKYHTGQAPDVAQVSTVTFSAISIGETYSITINSKTVSFVATDTLQATACTALMNAWNSSAEPEHQEFVASGGVTSVILTARATGTITTITADATGAPTATVTATTAASGPNIAFGIAANWSGGTNPAAGDSLVFNGTHDILYGMTSADDYDSITVPAGSGAIGLPATNVNGYPEFRTRYLTPDTTGTPMILNIGEGIGTQPARVQIDCNTRETYMSVYGSGNSFNASAPILIKNLGSSSTVNVYGGVVDFQCDSATTIGSFVQVPLDRNQPKTMIGSNLVITTGTVAGGELSGSCEFTTLTISNTAIVSITGAGEIGTCYIQQQGILKYKSVSYINTKLHVYGSGTADFSEDGAYIECPACDIYANGSIKDPHGRVGFNSGIVLMGCRLQDVYIDVGYARTLGVT